jgi:hypothetical protein
MECGFSAVGGALAAEENPVVVNTTGDDAGVVVTEGLKLLEGAFEEGKIV